MNFSKKRPVKIVMLGAGGTGAHIAPHLYRLLYALERPVKFIICDGDKVEPKKWSLKIWCARISQRLTLAKTRPG